MHGVATGQQPGQRLVVVIGVVPDTKYIARATQPAVCSGVKLPFVSPALYGYGYEA